MQTWTHRWLVELVQHLGQRRASIPALRTSEQRWGWGGGGEEQLHKLYWAGLFVESRSEQERVGVSLRGAPLSPDWSMLLDAQRRSFHPHTLPVTERQLPESGPRWFKHGQREKVFAWETGASPERVRVHTVDIHTVEQSLQTLFLFFLSFLFKDLFLFTNTPLPLNKDKVLTSPPKKEQKQQLFITPLVRLALLDVSF